MNGISNKTIVSLLMVVMIITVVGTVFSVNKLEEFVGRFSMLTGAATTGTGYVNLTTASNVAVTVLSNIDFGTGYVNESNLTANVTSNVSYSAATGWINTSGTSWNSQNITINNTGNTIVNLTYNASSSVANWIGGTNPDARIAIVDNEGGSCTGNLNTTNFRHQINTTVQNGCTSTTQGLGLDFLNTQDTLATVVQLLLPNNLLLGQRSNTITFTATANQ